MLVIDFENLNSFTKLSKNICLEVLETVQKEFGEIGNPLIEDNFISFEVYRAYFEDAPSVIKFKSFSLKLIDKYDDPFFTLCYKVKLNKNKNKLEF